MDRWKEKHGQNLILTWGQRKRKTRTNPYPHMWTANKKNMDKCLSSHVDSWQGKHGHWTNPYPNIAGLGIRSFDFRANRSYFVKKWANERFALKNERFTHLLILGERPERFAQNCSFPLSDLSKSLMGTHLWWATWAIRSHRSFDSSKMSDSLTSLTKKEEMSRNEQKWAKMSDLLTFSIIFLCILNILKN